MPWEKQFDIDWALEKAMRTFWARGYEATSMQDLVDGMGVNRGSLYATFGDKRSLFIQALKRYDASRRAAWTAKIARRRTPRATILAVFETVIDSVLKGGARDGCLLVNTAVELAPHDPEISAIVRDGMAETERFFREMIESGQDGGDIPDHVDAPEAARALLGLYVGLRVFSRSRPEKALLRSLARQAAALLD